jgi:sorbitol-specific phosphotransferase system component IIBC
MDDDEREALLRRINRGSATVGAQVPETITVHGEELPLAEFIIETRKVDGVPPEAVETLDTAKRALREERAERVDRLETEPLETETAETIADEVVGIDRALNALQTIRHPDYGDEASTAVIDDHKRWLGFLDRIQ